MSDSPNGVATPVQPLTGTFDKDMLDLLNALTAQAQAVLEQRAQVLHAYAAGARMGQGQFNWNAKTGVWTFVPVAAPT